MKIFIAGNSHLTHYTKIGAAFRGLNVTNDEEEADLILIAQDTYTYENGVRDVQVIEGMILVYCSTNKPVILMSQVPPGFCRKQNRENLYHYPETLRIKDSYERACNPEYIIIGHQGHICDEVIEYSEAFKCPVAHMVYESAEIAKIAVNTYLAMQVEYANRMSSVATKVGANWELVAQAIAFDKRIGDKAYLTPGRWQDSLHLLRDSVTLKEIECTQKNT